MSNKIYDFNRKARRDDSITNTFTEDHLQIVSDNFDYIKENYADGILNEDFQHIQLREVNPELIERDHVLFDSLNRRYQLVREGGRNPKLNEIGISLADRGYLLDEPMPVLFYNNKESYSIITGMTRDYWLGEYNFTNMVAYLFEAKDNATEDGIAQEIAELGLLLNPKTPPSAASSSADVIKYGLRACNEKWLDISNVSEGVAYDMIKQFIKRSIKSAGLGNAKWTYCTQAILNQAEDYTGSVVLPFNNDDTKDFLKENKYIDIPGKVRYLVKAYDMPHVAMIDAINLAAQFPKEEIRLVIHCGLLGADAQNTFENRMNKFWSKKNECLSSFQQVIFNGKTKDIQNFTLYGGVPQIAKNYNMMKLVKYNQLDGSLSQ